METSSASAGGGHDDGGCVSFTAVRILPGSLPHLTASAPSETSPIDDIVEEVKCEWHSEDAEGGESFLWHVHQYIQPNTLPSPQHAVQGHVIQLTTMAAPVEGESGAV
jgi:hypothetical protein